MTSWWAGRGAALTLDTKDTQLVPQFLAQTLQNICQFVPVFNYYLPDGAVLKIKGAFLQTVGFSVQSHLNVENQPAILFLHKCVPELLQNFKLSEWVDFLVTITAEEPSPVLPVKPPSVDGLRQEETTACRWPGATLWRWILVWERLSACNSCFCCCALSICPFGTLSPSDIGSENCLWQFLLSALKWSGTPLVKCNTSVWFVFMQTSLLLKCLWAKEGISLCCRVKFSQL